MTKAQTRPLVAYCYGATAGELNAQVEQVEAYAAQFDLKVRICREVRRPGKPPGASFEHALASTRTTKGTLVVATLGDIARQANALQALSGVDFRVLDDPILTPAALPLLIRTAREHADRSARVKTALANKRATLNSLSEAERATLAGAGGRLKLGGQSIDDAGRQSSSVSRRMAADARLEIVRAEVRKLLDVGVTNNSEIARKLNDNGVKRPRGGDWDGRYVSRITLDLRRSR